MESANPESKSHLGALQNGVCGLDMLTARGQIKIQQNGAHTSVTLDQRDLCETFGVAETSVAEHLLSRLIGVLHPEPDQALQAATIADALSLVRSIGPKDAAEAMTATLMVGAHLAAQDCLRRAMHPAQTPGGRALYLGLSMKATKAFAQLKQSLDLGRGKCTTQRVIVERLNVEPGGQAVIAVDARHGGGG
jgi:hypothetical protein